MTSPTEPDASRLSLSAIRRIDDLCTRYETDLQNGVPTRIEDLIPGDGGDEHQQLLLELLLIDLAHRSPAEIDQLTESFLSRFPSDRSVIQNALLKHQQLLGKRQEQHSPLSANDSAANQTVLENPSSVPRRLRYLEDYELLEEIARGGMGVVYKARDRRDNRHVAVKLMLLGDHATPQQSERFIHEAKTASRLQHPNIVPVYEVGYRDGSPYFVMDYVDGQNLETLHEQQPVSELQAVRFVKAAAQAVAYAHQLGILHRDLKPSNLLVDARLRLRVTDFGLAKWLDESESLTHTGEIMGTPGFMPPEQAAGKRRVGQYTFESDVYGLGAILYYLLTGRPPHQGDSAIDVIHSVIHSDPPNPSSIRPSIPPELEAICLKCLQKNPRKRYPSASDLVQDLENWLLRKPVLAAQSKSRIGAAPLWKQFAISFAATAVCLLFFGVLMRGNHWFSGEVSDQSTPAIAGNQNSGHNIASLESDPAGEVAEPQVVIEKVFDPREPKEIVALRAPKPDITQLTQRPAENPTRKPHIGANLPIPGGLLGALFKSSWTTVPAETRAMAVVHHMQDFSDKLDYFAELIGREPPHVLQTAMEETQIRAGLNQDGSLLWLAGKTTTDGTPLVYLLPATRFDEMIGRLDPREIKPPHKLRGYHRVQTDGWNFLSKPSKQYGLFVEEPWVNWANQVVKSTGGFDQKLGPFNGYLRRQDIGFVLTREAIAEGITIGLPFSDGGYLIPKSMQQLSDLFFDLSGFTAMGGGTRLTPLTGITVSGAAAIDPQSAAAQWHQSMQYQRDDLLRSLPADLSALVIAANSCDEWNQWLAAYCQNRFGANFDFSGLRAVCLQIAARPDVASLSEPIHVQLKVEDAQKLFADLQQLLPLVFRDGIARNEIAIRTDPQANRPVTRLWIKPEHLKWMFAENGYPNVCLTMTVLDRHTIVIQGVSADYLSDQMQGKVSLDGVIARLQQQTVSLIDDPRYQTTLQMMSPDSQQVLLLDLFGTTVTLQGLSNATNPGGTPSGNQVPGVGYGAFFQNSPPLGMSNRLTSEMIELDVVAPNDLLKPLAEMGLFR